MGYSKEKEDISIVKLDEGRKMNLMLNDCKTNLIGEEKRYRLIKRKDKEKVLLPQESFSLEAESISERLGAITSRAGEGDVICNWLSPAEEVGEVRQEAPMCPLEKGRC